MRLEVALNSGSDGFEQFGIALGRAGEMAEFEQCEQPFPAFTAGDNGGSGSRTPGGGHVAAQHVAHHQRFAGVGHVARFECVEITFDKGPDCFTQANLVAGIQRGFGSAPAVDQHAVLAPQILNLP